MGNFGGTTRVQREDASLTTCQVDLGYMHGPSLTVCFLSEQLSQTGIHRYQDILTEACFTNLASFFYNPVAGGLYQGTPPQKVMVKVSLSVLRERV